MPKPPYFPFYYQDFLTGTRFFTNAQTGAYIRLLLDQWDLGVLKEKHFVARMNGISQEECKEIRLKFRSVSIKNVEGFQNERLEKVRKHVTKVNKSRSDSAKLGVKARAEQTVNQMVEQNDTKRLSKTEPNGGHNQSQISKSNIKTKIQNQISLSPGKKSKKKPPSFPWPEDFVLTIHLMDYATKQGIPDPVEEFENFRLNALAKSYVYADWSAAWMKWCRDDRTNKKPKEEDYV